MHHFDMKHKSHPCNHQHSPLCTHASTVSMHDVTVTAHVRINPLPYILEGHHYFLLYY